MCPREWRRVVYICEYERLSDARVKSFGGKVTMWRDDEIHDFRMSKSVSVNV